MAEAPLPRPLLPAGGRRSKTVRAVRRWTAVFIVGLVISGLTAQPVEIETRLLARVTNALLPDTAAAAWTTRIERDIAHTAAVAPYLFYGFDWLAYGHVAIAIVFVWAYRDPVRHAMLYDYGLVICIGVVPWALFHGHLRGIPLPWQLIDMSFGLLGSVPLLRCEQLLRQVDQRAK